MKKYFLILLIFTLTAISCKKFLDVAPTNQALEDNLFSDRAGFENALAGVYYDMTSNQLYGVNTKFGYLDALVGYFDIPEIGNLYSDAHLLNYNLPNSQVFTDSIWGSNYKIINEINLILKNIERIKTDDNYSIIKGEALGLRAYLHLDLLRMFGPVIGQEGLSAKAIPYYDSILNAPSKFLTASQVFDKIFIDLNAAQSLLNADPIKNYGATGNANSSVGTFQYNSLLDHRGLRMNYYAVKAIKARAYLWKGNNDSASYYANSVISDSAVRLIKTAAIGSSAVKDLRFTTEGIFNLYTVNDGTLIPTYFPLANNTNITTQLFLLPDFSYLEEELYAKTVGGSINDYRYLYWFTNSQTGNISLFQKYYTDPNNIDNTSTAFYYQHQRTLIGLAEMYYIKAETLVPKNPQSALTVLNSIRATRNVTIALTYTKDAKSPADVLNFIMDERRKDYIGDGQLFFEYKRLFRPIERSTGNIAPTLSIFKLPVPNLENIYNPNN